MQQEREQGNGGNRGMGGQQGREQGNWDSKGGNRGIRRQQGGDRGMGAAREGTGGLEGWGDSNTTTPTCSQTWDPCKA